MILRIYDTSYVCRFIYGSKLDQKINSSNMLQYYVLLIPGERER